MLRRGKPAPATSSTPSPPSTPAPPGPARVVVPLDPTLGMPAAAPVQAAAKAGRVAEVSRLVREIQSPTERGWVIRAVASDVWVADALRGWSSAEPTCSDALAAWGGSLVAQAWQARGQGGSDRVPKEKFEEFWSLLRTADQTLVRATVLDPTSPIPWVWLLRTGRGLEISRHELRLRFDHAVARGPLTLEAAVELLESISAKWSGSHDDMYAFATATAAGAPDGSPLHALPVLAHIERGLASDKWLPDHMVSVAAEVDAAAARSVQHPQFDDTGYDAALARNIIAFAVAMCGNTREFLRQRDAIGERLLPNPWSYRGNPETVFANPVPGPRPS